jgi:hypothetical protein
MKYLLLTFLFVSFQLRAQELELVSSVALDTETFVGVDSYNNVYSISNMVLYKEGGDGSFSFNDFQLGRLSSVDILNPLKVVLFYEDTNTALLLDNRLNLIERIAFNNLVDFINVGNATNAGNSNLWIFNVDSQQLELFNYITNAKNVVSQPFSGKIVSQASDFNYCFTLTESELREFNRYGSLLFELPMKGYEKIIYHGKHIIALKENKLFLLDYDSLNTGKPIIRPINVGIPENNIKDLYLTEDFMYIYDGKNLHTFSTKLSKK